MKRHFPLFFALIFAVSCGNPDYGSVGEEGQLVHLPLPSEGENHRRPIQEVIDSYEDLGGEIGGKDRALIDLSATAGGNALSERGADSVSPDPLPWRRDNRRAGAGNVTNVQLQITDQQSPLAGADSEDTLIDILFYMQDRRSSCVRKFRQAFQSNEWFAQLNNFHWQAMFSFFSEEVDLLPLEERNGVPYDTDGPDDFFDSIFNFYPEWDYLLTKGEYPAELAHSMILSTLHPLETKADAERMTQWRAVFLDTGRDPRGGTNHNYSPNLTLHNSHRLNTNGRVADPLSGLRSVLAETHTHSTHSLRRTGALTVIFLFGDSFPFYNEQTWKKFFNNHQPLKIYFITDRSNDIGNLQTVLGDDNFQFINCDSLIRKQYFIRAH